MGGKSKVIHLIKDYFPNFNNIDGYVEPFVGAGNVFFYLKENGYLENIPVYLSDINAELINTHIQVRDNLNKLIPLLEKHEKLNSEKHYYDIRNRFPPGIGMTDIEKAAAFIYLTHSVFGGQWRVNSQGKCNKAYSGKNNIILVNDELYKCSKLLQDTTIKCHSFDKILELDERDNIFCYQDPPYYDVNSVSYAKDGFCLNTRLLIPKVFVELDKRGNKVMMSNADCPTIYKLFDKYNIIPIKTNRNDGLSWNGPKLGYNEIEKLKEVVVTNYSVTKKQRMIEDAWS